MKICICEHPKSKHDFLLKVKDAERLGAGASFDQYKCSGEKKGKKVKGEYQEVPCDCLSYQESPFFK